MVGSVFLELHASKEMDIRGMGIQIGQTEGNFSLGDGLVFLGIINEALLDEIAAPAAPTGPEAKLEKSDREGGRGNRPENTDKRLLSTEFGPHIFTENRGLEVWKNEIGTHELK